MRYGQVLTLTPLNHSLSYKIEETNQELSVGGPPLEDLGEQDLAWKELPLQVGQIVKVPFRNKSVLGVVESLTQTPPFEGPLKSIQQSFTFTLPLISLQFAQWVAHYTLIPIGQVLKMVIGLSLTEVIKADKGKDCLEDFSYTFHHPVTLSAQQEDASQQVVQALGSFQPFVLDGVTGSGKTEVYLTATEEVLKKQGQVLVLLPEISLTHQFLQRFKQRFGCQPLVWHSNITLKQKRHAWQRLLKGEAVIVVGARSALFLPFPNLQLLIVDEEHDDSYKQQDQNHYHARDMAVVRAKFSKIPIILTSATPSLETISNIKKVNMLC